MKNCRVGKACSQMLGMAAILALLLVPSAMAQQDTGDLERSYFKATQITKVGADGGDVTAQRTSVEGHAVPPKVTVRTKLAGCSDETNKEFLKSMIFVDGRLASARVTDIRRCLGGAKYNEVLQFFGVGTAADHENYWCGSRATCKRSDTDICTSNCRSLTASEVGDDKGYVVLAHRADEYTHEVGDDYFDRLDFANGTLDGAFLREPVRGSGLQ